MSKKRNSKKSNVSTEENIFSYIIKDYNSCGSLSSAEGQNIPKDLRDAILYESSFKRCLWENCDLTNVSGNGCQFITCDFCGNKVINTAFQHSTFDDNIFYNNNFLGSNLAYSIFEWNTLKESNIDGCAFTGATFSNTTIRNCTIKHSNFELCVFQNTTFIDVDLSNLALKYVFFKDVKMKNVRLPFMQIPYTFGGMKYVFSQKDNIRIVTTNPQMPLMTVKAYKKLLPQLIDFFYKQSDFFPLANCYLANDQIERAKKANNVGIITSTSVCDFRKLYFFCIQATQEIRISKEERRDIYNKISNNIRFENLSGAEYREFRHYFPMIKRLMFDNPYNNPTLSISLHTNIAADNFKNLGLLMKTLDMIAENSGAKLDSKHLEIRHNSPNIVDWFPIGELPDLLNILSNTINIIKPFITEEFPKLLQNVGAIATIIGTVYTAKAYKESRTKSEENSEIIEQKDNADLDKSNSNAACASDEIRKMRKELEDKKAEYQRKMASKFHTTSIKMKESDNAFFDIVKEIEKENIKINDLEVHLLGDQTNLWEYIYNNGDVI